ncbi:MAG TPA: ADOP family duplicated permease, partial [Opitutaceae bacterium]
SVTNYYERRGKIPAFSSIAEISEGTSVLGESGSTTIEKNGRVTSEFFSTLGVAPLMGRAFTDAELTYQTDHEAILSYECWTSRYGADPKILGKSIRMDGIERVIVGVLPQNFRYLSFQAPVYTPLSTEERERNVNARHNIGKELIGRLAPGATLAEAQEQVDALDLQIAPLFPDAAIITQAGAHTVVAPLRADYVASVRPTLVLLQAGALFLLVIGGVNLVNLLLIRASSRSRELTIRQALGASSRHIVREVMTETLLLSLAGGVAGLLVGAAGIRLLAAFGAGQLPLGSEIVFNGGLAVVAIAGAVVTGIVIGAPVSWFNVRDRLAGALQAESRGSTAGRATQRLRHVFIVAQIALAFVLLVGAGLLGLSLRRAMAVRPGFSADHVITGQFSLTWKNYHDGPSIDTFFDRLYEKGRSLPGVSAFGAISNVPVNGKGGDTTVVVPGHPPPGGPSAVVVHDAYAVVGDYFKAMGVPLVEGRFLNEADAHVEQLRCVVDQTFARLYWPGEDPIGKLVYTGTTIGPNDKPYTVVGIVGDIKQMGLASTKPNPGAIYFTFNGIFFRNFFLVARTGLPPEALGGTMAKVIRDLDRDMPFTDVQTMDYRISDSLATRRSPALMAGIFGVTALLLAAVGLYGVMAYAVVQRTREFGVRLALGAQRTDVLRLVFLEGVRLAAAGVAAGLAVSLLLSRYMESFLFGVRAYDPVAYAG